MAMIIEQRAQLFQSLGSIGTSAANAAAEGISNSAKTDSKTVETALKLFGGFDRSEFENINGEPVPDDGMPNLLVPAVRPPASYEAPAEYFKPLSNTVEGQGLLVPAKDLLLQLQDPRFRMADGLSGFSDNRITQSLAQKGMIINSKPGGDVNLGGLDENGIIIVGGKPAEAGDMVASLDSFGKLYRMENTVEKQLQLHQQLDFSAFGNFSGAGQNPRLDRGLKDLPDTQAATQSKEILNLVDHALSETPKTVGEMVQMLDVLLAKTNEIMEGPHSPFISDALHKELCLTMQQNLSNLKNICQNFPPNSKPNPALLEYLQRARQAMQQLLPIG